MKKSPVASTRRYHHIGIPTTERREGERLVKGHATFVSGYETSAYGIEWMRFEPEASVPELVRTVPHVAFEVDDLSAEIAGKEILIAPNSPSPGVTVAFIVENGAPVEFLQHRPEVKDMAARPDYALGYTSSEHERLIRQAKRIAPYTERLFREAGIGPGQRVLDLGSGVADVSMLLARIVGPSGEVVGIERNAHSIARANARIAEAGQRNITFTQADVTQIASDQPFDAAVGRFILMFLPDPASVLRSLTRLVRPGGVLAFQEPTWIPLLALGAPFPLWSKLLYAIHETFLRSGVNPEMGLALCRMFQEIGLPAPAMHIETPLGSDTDFTSLICDLFSSVQPLAQQHKVPLDALGDLDTLTDRVQAEVAASNTVVSFVPMVGVWARKPD